VVDDVASVIYLSLRPGAVKLAGAAQRPGSDPVDIEDLVKLGAKLKGTPCQMLLATPYHAISL